MDFAASRKDNPVVEHEPASAVHVATSAKAPLLKELLKRTPLTHEPPPPFGVVHETSVADQVVAPLTDGVKDAAFAISEILSCLVAVASTMFATVMLASLAVVSAVTLVTLNAMAAGTVTVACSLTLAVSVVVWLVSGSVTDV